VCYERTYGFPNAITQPKIQNPESRIQNREAASTQNPQSDPDVDGNPHREGESLPDVDGQRILDLENPELEGPIHTSYNVESGVIEGNVV
jgi:hypothetical protein